MRYSILVIAFLFTGCAISDSAMALHKEGQSTVRYQTKEILEYKALMLELCSKIPQEVIEVQGVKITRPSSDFRDCVAVANTNIPIYEPSRPKDMLESTGQFISNIGGTLLGGAAIWANWHGSKKGMYYNYQQSKLQTEHQGRVMDGMFGTVNANSKSTVINPQIVNPQVIKPEVIQIPPHPVDKPYLPTGWQPIP